MMQQDHESIVELIPAYAIGAADPDERGAIDEHLKSCVECRLLLADYTDLGDDLLFAAPLAPAPVRLGEDLRRRIGPAAPAPTNRSWLRFLRQPAVAAGLAVVALLVLTNVYWAGRVGQLERRANEYAALAQAPGITLRAPGAGDRAYATGAADGVVYVRPGSSVALLCVYAMPQLEQGRTYQAWLVKDGQRTSAGTFDVSRDGYGVLLIDAGRPISEYQQLGITVEPAGGSPAPTTPRVIGGNL